jgi:uncharacterized Tic20 family protein
MEASETNEYEQERASNIYLMSLAIVIVGLPFPIINFLATFFMYLSNRSGSYFIRWHSLQALLSQGVVALLNASGIIWTMSVIFGQEELSNSYIAFILTILVFNLAELAGTIYAAIQTRKGQHVDFWFFGPLTDLICKK